MRSYIDWLKDDGFHLAQTWDTKTNDWAGPGNMVVFPVIEDVLGHALTPGEDGKMPYITVVYSTIKKSGKSMIGASVLAWGLEEYPAGTQIYTLANDLDQAEGIIFQDLAYHVEKKFGIQARNHRITLPNGSFVQALAHHYRTVAGSRHTVTMWDELWAFNKEGSRRLWAEMTPIPTVKNPLRIIVTYAGFHHDESPLLNLYQRVVGGGKTVKGLEHIKDRLGRPVCFEDPSSKTFIMWHTEPIMPWQTSEYYATQMESLSPSEFLRLHRNQWVSSKEMFIQPDWWDRLTVLEGPVHLVKDHPGRNKPVIAAVDAGLKKDTSVVAGVYYDPETKHVGLAFHKIWIPVKGEILDLEETVEEYLLEMQKFYNIVEVAYDPSQLQRTMSTMRKKRMNTYEYPQTPNNLLRITNTFYDLIKHGLLDVYKDDELKEQIVNAVIKNTGRGIQFTKNAVLTSHPSDAAVAIAMAVTRAMDWGAILPEGNQTVELPFAENEPFEPWEKEMLHKIPESLRPREFLEGSWFDSSEF